MTGDATPTSDEARQAAAKALLDEGGGPGNGLHSWRCEYPDRYGPCDCVQEVADLILAAAAPLLVSADSSAQAERLRRERDRWEDEAKGWERHLIAAEVVVEGLRAELANEVELRKSYQREVAALRAAGGQEKPSGEEDTGKLRLLVEPHPNQWAAIQLHDAVLAAADEIDRLRTRASRWASPSPPAPAWWRSRPPPA